MTALLATQDVLAEVAYVRDVGIGADAASWRVWSESPLSSASAVPASPSWSNCRWPLSEPAPSAKNRAVSDNHYDWLS